jgi:hypothetical protein
MEKRLSGDENLKTTLKLEEQLKKSLSFEIPLLAPFCQIR